MNTAIFKKGDTIFELYTVEAGPYTGANANVYKVRHTLLGYARAFIILHNPVYKDAFIQGATLWSTFLGEAHSKNIVQFFELLHAPEQAPCFIIEWLDGGPLDYWIDSGMLYKGDDAQAAYSKILHIALQSAQGLLDMQKNGVIHRHVKPANIMLGAQEGKDFSVKLSGLEVAVALDKKIEFAVKTPMYAPPEQLTGSVINASFSLDVFGWAASVMHMLAGKLLWKDGKELSNTFDAIPAQFKVYVPQSLIELLKSATSLDANCRPSWTHIIKLLKEIR